MWKIERLELKNFVGLGSNGRYSVNLDLSGNSNVINLIIGKMGSGKTTILGHLQPFATYGTLDTRNQDRQIVYGLDGRKTIEYTHNGKDHYTIVHVYTWHAKTENHSVKSFMTLNGVTLNPNGNIGAFKELVKLHFGIDQNFLRLIRLGSNVSNVINMKAAERKNFMASLLSDSEIYQILYGKLQDEYRALNGAISLLTKKLVGVTPEKEAGLKDLISQINGKYRDVENRVLGLKNEYQMKKGALRQLTDDMTKGEIAKRISDAKDAESQLETEIFNITSALSSIEDVSFNIPEGLQKIGALSQEIDSLSSIITNYLEEIRQHEIALAKLNERKLLCNNEEHIQELRKTVDELSDEWDRVSQLLGATDFASLPSKGKMVSIMSAVDTISPLIVDLASYPEETISRLYFANSSILSYARKQIDMLTSKVISLTKQMGNMKFSSGYETPYPLIRPVLCPTSSCPFITTHPYTLSHDTSTGIDHIMYDIQTKIQVITAEIASYEEYETIFRKLNAVKKIWSDIAAPLQTMGAIKNGASLLDILTNSIARHNWCNHGRLNEISSLIEMNERKDEIRDRANEARKELQTLMAKDEMASIMAAIQSTIIKISEIKTNLEHVATVREEKDKEKEDTEKILETLMTKDKLEGSLSQLSMQQQQTGVEIERLQAILSAINEFNQYEDRVSPEIDRLTMDMGRLRKMELENSQLLRDIDSTKADYADATASRDILKILLSALSTKEGIPMLMVKSFLDGAKDTLNELISDVFSDDLEILDFKITDAEFKIPYAVNGVVVDDIDKASQGQRAIISIALSFALIRQSMTDYNIMLLDEVDGPLYHRDREKFISILYKQLSAIDSNQVFIISHNNSFVGQPANIILTTPEMIESDSDSNWSVFKLYK